MAAPQAKVALLSRSIYQPFLQSFYRLAKYHVLAIGTSIAGSVVDLFPQAHAFFPEYAISDAGSIKTFRTSKKVKWLSTCEKAFVQRFGAYSYNAYGRNSNTLPAYKAEIGVSSEFITHFGVTQQYLFTHRTGLGG